MKSEVITITLSPFYKNVAKAGIKNFSHFVRLALLRHLSEKWGRIPGAEFVKALIDDGKSSFVYQEDVLNSLEAFLTACEEKLKTFSKTLKFEKDDASLTLNEEGFSFTFKDTPKVPYEQYKAKILLLMDFLENQIENPTENQEFNEKTGYIYYVVHE